MSDLNELVRDVKDIDRRTQKIEQKIFNGMSESLKDLKEKLPQLMTKEDHAAIEAAKLEQMREMGKKKDRQNRALIAFVPLVTALLLRLLDMI